MYSDEIAFSVMMDNLESVQQSLRQELKKGREIRGEKRGGGGSMTTEMKKVWAMETACKTANKMRERRK